MTRSGVRQSVFRRVMREDGYHCALCGIAGREVRKHNRGAKNATFSYPTIVACVSLSIDHVVPRSRGGSSERSNLRILCTTCNSLRQAPATLVASETIEEHW